MTRMTAQRGAAQKYFREVVLQYDGNECLIWPFGRHNFGYGMVYHDGRMRLVHRLLCEAEYGPAPSKHDAAHSCGKGHLGCVAKRHLSWKTRTENVADARAHGTIPAGERNGQAKLTSDDVVKIRDLRGTLSQRQLARQFRVSQGTIHKIQTGQRW